MTTDKTRKVLKRKLQNPVAECKTAELTMQVVANLLEPGWDRGIDLVFASLDRKTLTLAYYEH